MSLVRKKVTPRLIEGNRANSRKSTGPRSELGKKHSRLNSLKHMVYAQVVSASMKELGEDPAKFDKLCDSLRRAFRPQDGFEEMLVNDMAEIRWRRQRLLRAESGIVASQKREFEIDRELRFASRRIGFGAQIEVSMMSGYGLCGLPDSVSKFSEIRETLEALQALVAGEGFPEDGLKVLEVVYGRNPGMAGLLLRKRFEVCRQEHETGDGAVQKTIRESFIQVLDAEIASFAKLALLFLEKEGQASEPAKDARFVPSGEHLDKVVRYEAHLERQFKEKLQLLVAWRRARGEGVPVEEPERQRG